MPIPKKCPWGFSTFTSLEALEIYQEYLAECLTILTTCGGSYEAIAKYLEISEYMVDTYMRKQEI
jgi:hypothetical protein